MEEIWRPVQGYEGKYEVSNLGRVRTLSRQNRWNDSLYPLKKPLYNRAYEDKFGYSIVVLTKFKQRKTCLVHRLVALAFIPNPEGLPVINHKDENKRNNRVDNLEWCTIAYNNSYGTVKLRQRLSNINHPQKSTPVLCLKQGAVIAEYPSMSEAQRQTKAWQPHIMQCCQGKRKTAGGYGWRYKFGRIKPEVINRVYKNEN